MPKGMYPRKPGLKRNRKQRPFEDRFWEKVDKTETCWIWIGAIAGTGYGSFNLGRRQDGYDVAHRVSYRLLRGPIPEGCELDHLCRIRKCVRPDHLEPVSHRENVMRGASPMITVSLSGQCKRGHDASEAVLKNGTGRVAYCKACRRESRATRNTH